MGSTQSISGQRQIEKLDQNNQSLETNLRYKQVYQTVFRRPTLDALKTLFPESKRLSEGLFNLFISAKNNTYQSFTQIVALLTSLDIQPTINQRLKQVADETSILDRYFMIVYHLETTKTYRNIEVQQEDKLNCIFEFLSLFCTPEQNQINKLAQILGNYNQKQMLSEFVQKFKNIFINSQKLLITYWTEKFSNTNTNKRFSIFSQPPNSNLLGFQDWFLLGMRTIKIFKNQPTLLFSLQKNGSSFHSLYRHLIGYNGPWLFVVSHWEKDLITKQLKICIFGSFQNTCVQDVNTYQGNLEGFLFRLGPNFRTFDSYHGEGESNFLKINTTEPEISKKPRGIGFGGKDNNDFKIWIDQLIQSGSYVTNQNDSTYGSGSVAFPSTTFLKIRDLQIWGLGDEQSLQHRQQYWLNREQESLKRRKVNKKDLLSGGLTNILFQNTFKHRQQIVGQIDRKSQELL